MSEELNRLQVNLIRGVIIIFLFYFDFSIEQKISSTGVGTKTFLLVLFLLDANLVFSISIFEIEKMFFLAIRIFFSLKQIFEKKVKTSKSRSEILFEVQENQFCGNFVKY